MLNLNYLLNLKQKPVIIVANGLFPTKTQVLDLLLSQAHAIIACDGALNQLDKFNLKIDYAIGDNDSIQFTNFNQLINPYLYNPDQNTNDLTKALNLAKTLYPQTIPMLILAATGKREDHALANIALLIQYSKIFPTIHLVSDFGVFTHLRTGTFQLNSYPGEQISFFSFKPKTKVSCLELKWPLSQQEFRHLNSGTLNHATSSKLNITTSQSLLVYRAFEIKAQN